MGGYAEFSAERVEPGVVRQISERAGLVVGELNGESSWRLECLQAACDSAGIGVRVSDVINSVSHPKRRWTRSSREIFKCAATSPRMPDSVPNRRGLCLGIVPWCWVGSSQVNRIWLPVYRVTR
jgi:hypothetical protein